MRLSQDFPCRLARLLFSTTLAFIWAGGPNGSPSRAQAPAASSAPAPTGQPEPAAAFKAAREQFDALWRTVEAIRRDLPRDGFDPQAVFDQVGPEPAKLVAWVHEQTRWLPYRGMLRGPVGVLQDRSGSSLDRALLLADLLRRAGITVRLACANLADAEATEVWRAFAKPVTVMETAPLSVEDVSEIGARSARKYGMDPAAAAAGASEATLQTQRLVETLTERVAQQEPLLLEQLGFAAPGTQPVAADQPSLAELAAAKDHWWVQYRQTDKWIDADPLRPTGPWSTPVRTIDWPSDAASPGIDEALCHTVTIRVVAEKLLDDKRTTATALEKTLRPADLFGRRISLFHHPTNWPSDLVDLNADSLSERWQQAVAQQAEWVPMLSIDDATHSQAGVMINGDLNARPALVPIKQGGQAVAGAGGAASDLLSAGLAPQAAATSSGVWSAEWIEFEFKSPGRDARIERREVFDLLGPVRRAAGEMAVLSPDKAAQTRGLALMSCSELLFTPCKLDPSYVQDLAMASLLDARTALSSGLDAASKGDAKGALGIFHIVPFAQELYTYSLLRHLAGRWRDAIYLDQTNVAAFHQRLIADDRGALFERTIFDIVANDVAVRPGTSVGARQVRLAQGIIDTNAESLAAREGTYDMTGIFEAAEAQGVEWVTLRRADDPAWSNVKLSPDAVTRIRAELAAGATIVVPSRTVARNGREQVAWWRFDPGSGRCLGMTEFGGAVSAENAMLLRAIFLVSMISNYAGCGGFAAGASVYKKVGCGVCAIALAAISTYGFAGAGGAGNAAASIPAAKAASGAAGAAASTAGGWICNAVSAAVP